MNRFAHIRAAGTVGEMPEFPEYSDREIAPAPRQRTEGVLEETAPSQLFTQDIEEAEHEQNADKRRTAPDNGSVDGCKRNEGKHEKRKTVPTGGAEKRDRTWVMNPAETEDGQCRQARPPHDTRGLEKDRKPRGLPARGVHVSPPEERPGHRACQDVIKKNARPVDARCFRSQAISLGGL